MKSFSDSHKRQTQHCIGQSGLELGLYNPHSQDEKTLTSDSGLQVLRAQRMMLMTSLPWYNLPV